MKLFKKRIVIESNFIIDIVFPQFIGLIFEYHKKKTFTLQFFFFCFLQLSKRPVTIG